MRMCIIFLAGENGRSKSREDQVLQIAHCYGVHCGGRCRERNDMKESASAKSRAKSRRLHHVEQLWHLVVTRHLDIPCLGECAPLLQCQCAWEPACKVNKDISKVGSRGWDGQYRCATALIEREEAAAPFPAEVEASEI